MSTLRDKLMRLETVQNDRQRAMEGLADALETFIGKKLFAIPKTELYKHSKSVQKARAALDAARPFLTGT